MLWTTKTLYIIQISTGWCGCKVLQQWILYSALKRLHIRFKKVRSNLSPRWTTHNRHKKTPTARAPNQKTFCASSVAAFDFPPPLSLSQQQEMKNLKEFPPLLHPLLYLLHPPCTHVDPVYRITYCMWVQMKKEEGNVFRSCGFPLRERTKKGGIGNEIEFVSSHARLNIRTEAEEENSFLLYASGLCLVPRGREWGK